MPKPNLADQQYAARVASLLLSSFPNQPHDPKTLLRQLTVALTGRRETDLQSLVHPTGGFLNKTEFLSIGAVCKFLDEREERRHETTSYHPEHRRLPPPDEPELPKEERERRYRMLKGVAQAIRETVKAKCVGRPSTLPPPKQEHHPDKLLDGLANLEAAKPRTGGDQDAAA